MIPKASLSELQPEILSGRDEAVLVTGLQLDPPIGNSEPIRVSISHDEDSAEIYWTRVRSLRLDIDTVLKVLAVSYVACCDGSI